MPITALQIATRDRDGEEHVFILDLLELLPTHEDVVDSALTAVFQDISVLKVRTHTLQ
jgi:hypothetical protein